MAQFMVDAFNTVSCKFFWTKVQKRVSNALARWWLISFNTWRSWRESHALVTATMSSARNGIWLARSWTRCSTSLVPPMSIWARGGNLTLKQFMNVCRAIFSVATSEEDCMVAWANIAELLFFQGHDDKLKVPLPFHRKPMDIIEDMIEERVEKEVKKRLFLAEITKNTDALKD